MMTVKQRVAAALIAGAIGLSTIGVGAGVANAATPLPGSGDAHISAADQSTTQFVDWRGRGGYHHRGPGFGPGYGYGPGYYPDWHPWGWHPWGWRGW
jgi:hypothetical protein